MLGWRGGGRRGGGIECRCSRRWRRGGRCRLLELRGGKGKEWDRCAEEEELGKLGGGEGWEGRRNEGRRRGSLKGGRRGGGTTFYGRFGAEVYLGEVATFEADGS